MTEHAINLDKLARDRGDHSSFGPSSSAMYLNCAGSLIPNLMAPDSAGEDAAYGTVAHHVTETWGLTGERPAHLIGTRQFVESGDFGYMIDIDEVMLDHAQSCIEWVEFLPGVHYWERRVDFSRIAPIPNQRGTADFIACSPGEMVICDWKFGKGHVVYAEGNTQAQLYALGAFYEFDDLYHFETIEIRIAQPRVDHWDTWTITRQDLLDFADWAKPRMAAAWQINAPRTPGPKQCIFCKVKADCAALAKVQADLTAGAFTDLASDEVTEDAIAEFKDDLTLTAIPKVADAMRLTTGELATMMTWRGFVESWWKSAANELYRRACRGEEVPGWKLVESRSRRVFRYPTQAGTALVGMGAPEDKVFATSVCSPAEAEKLLRKAGHRTKDLPDLLDDLVYKPPGKPTLAPAHDKRPALVDVSESAFDDLTENPENRESEEI